MEKTNITLNGTNLLAHYEYDKGESETNDHPGCFPSVRLWSVFNENDKNITETITSMEWIEIETMCFNKEID